MMDMLPTWNEVAPRQRRRGTGRRAARAAILAFFILAPLSAIALSSLPGQDPARRLLAPTAAAPSGKEQPAAPDAMALAASEAPAAPARLADAEPVAEAPPAPPRSEDAAPTEVTLAEAPAETEDAPRAAGGAETMTPAAQTLSNLPWVSAAAPERTPTPVRPGTATTAAEHSDEAVLAVTPPARDGDAADARGERDAVAALPATEPHIDPAAGGSRPADRSGPVLGPSTSPAVQSPAIGRSAPDRGTAEQAALEPQPGVPLPESGPVPRPRPLLRRTTSGERLPPPGRPQVADVPLYAPLPPEAYARRRAIDELPPAPIPPAPVGEIDPRDGLILEGRVAPPGSRLLDLATAPFREAGRLIDRATERDRWRGDRRYFDEPGW